MGRSYSSAELDEIYEELEEGNDVAWARVTSQNCAALISRAQMNGNYDLEMELRNWR